VTYGRFVWQHPNPTAVIKSLRALIHEDASVAAALKVFDDAVTTEKTA
jgi:hypothetical protein